jgi:hypothetical protein
VLFRSKSILPVGRVNCFSPLGHSGQPKLQAVVGSILNEKGFPKKIAFLDIRDSQKLLFN